MENVCSLPSIDHMTGSKPVVTSPINRQQIPSPGLKTMSEPKGTLPPLSALLRQTPQHNLPEIPRESPDPVKHHHFSIMPNNTTVVHEKYNSVGHEESKQQQQQQRQQQALRTNSPLFPQNHISGQLNSPDHRPPQNSGAHSSQRSIDMRLPSIKHFENIPPKPHQTYPSQSVTQNMQIHSQPSQPPPTYNDISKSMSPPAQHLYPNNFNNSDSHSSSHLSPNSTMWTRPSAIPHSPRQSQQPIISSTSSPKAPIFATLEKPVQQPVRFVTNNYSSDYQNNVNGSFVKDNADSNVGTQNNNATVDKALSDMQKITDYCTIISQFATQYGEYRNQANNPFQSSPWTTPTGTPSVVNLDQQVTDMINRTCEILNLLNNIKSEIGQTVSNDQDTINLIRTKRTTVGPSATRTKYRKRSKRAAPPGRCHSCNISETPEWRRGPDGARTLCNACGLHFAKLTRKRALSAMAQHQSPQVHKLRPTPVLPSLQPIQPIQPIVSQPKPPMGIIGGIHLTQSMQSVQLMQSPPKHLRHEEISINHQMNGVTINGNYLKA